MEVIFAVASEIAVINVVVECCGVLVACLCCFGISNEYYCCKADVGIAILFIEFLIALWRVMVNGVNLSVVTRK